MHDVEVEMEVLFVSIREINDWGTGICIIRNFLLLFMIVKR